MVKKKKKYRPSTGQYILIAVVAVALLAGTFALGWHFGVESTRFHGNILLVNDTHRLSADYVPEGLVNLYQQRYSFRLASSVDLPAPFSPIRPTRSPSQRVRRSISSTACSP